MPSDESPVVKVNNRFACPFTTTKTALLNIICWDSCETASERDNHHGVVTQRSGGDLQSPMDISVLVGWLTHELEWRRLKGVIWKTSDWWKTKCAPHNWIAGYFQSNMIFAVCFDGSITTLTWMMEWFVRVHGTAWRIGQKDIVVYLYRPLRCFPIAIFLSIVRT